MPTVKACRKRGREREGTRGEREGNGERYIGEREGQGRECSRLSKGGASSPELDMENLGFKGALHSLLMTS